MKTKMKTTKTYKLFQAVTLLLVAAHAFSGLAAAADEGHRVIIDLNASASDVSDLKLTSGKGRCGEDMQWILDDEGTLTIKGTGDMYSYVDFETDEINIPWFKDTDAQAIKSVVIEDGVESVSPMAFYGTSVTDITFPESVKSIGKCSVANCKELINVILSDNITEIPEGAFNCDFKLESVHLPLKLKEIGAGAFLNCYKLHDLILPPEVTDIKQFAFSDCLELENIIIPEKVTTITYCSFEGCMNLSNVSFPNSVKVIEKMAFADCAGVEKIILPDGLEKIEERAFSYNPNDRDKSLSKQIIYIPESVYEIKKNAMDEDHVIYGFKGSAAELYAVDNNIEFVEVSDSMYPASDSKAQQPYTAITGTKETLFDNTQAFSDIDASEYADSIAKLSEYGIIEGYNSQFYPSKTLTRAEAAAIIARIYAKLSYGSDYDLSTENYVNQNLDSGIQFSDVPVEHWAYPYIYRASNEWFLIDGFDDGTFRPDENVTYAQLFKLVMNMTGYNVYADLEGGYPNGYVSQAMSIGLIKDYDNSLNDVPVKRDAAAEIIYNALNAPVVVSDGYVYDIDGVEHPTYIILDGEDKVTLLSSMSLD